MVWTGDGRVFFYNPSSRISVWERPDDLVGRQDVDKMVSTPPDTVGPVKPARQSDTSESSDEEQPPANKKIKLEETKSNCYPKNKDVHNIVFFVCEIALYLTILYLLATPIKEEEEKEGKKTIDIGKEAAIEAEVRAARERAIVPLETRIKSFKDMLAEKDVNYYMSHFIYIVYVKLNNYFFRYLHSVLGRKNFTRSCSIRATCF